MKIVVHFLWGDADLHILRGSSFREAVLWIIRNCKSDDFHYADVYIPGELMRAYKFDDSGKIRRIL